MAVQINRKHLSLLAREELDKADNKSKFVRDALEYYVRRDTVSNRQVDIKKELDDIKSMLANLTAPGSRAPQIETEEKPRAAKPSLDEGVKNIGSLKDEVDKNKKPKGVQKSRDSDVLSNEEKIQIEQMLDDSISLF